MYFKLMANIPFNIRDFAYYPDYLKYIAQNDNMKNEEIIITHHSECITLGQNSNKNEVLNAQEGLPIYQSDRAGGATYHDIGQLVLYPHINLRNRNISITEYINLIEQWGINALKDCEIAAKRGVNPGLWINVDIAKQAKIAFIGLAIRNNYSRHGIAFNLQNTKVENFSKIIACRSFEAIAKVNISFETLIDKLIKRNPFS